MANCQPPKKKNKLKKILIFFQLSFGKFLSAKFWNVVNLNFFFSIHLCWLIFIYIKILVNRSLWFLVLLNNFFFYSRVFLWKEVRKNLKDLKFLQRQCQQTKKKSIFVYRTIIRAKEVLVNLFFYLLWFFFMRSSFRLKKKEVNYDLKSRNLFELFSPWSSGIWVSKHVRNSSHSIIIGFSGMFQI